MTNIMDYKRTFVGLLLFVIFLNTYLLTGPSLMMKGFEGLCFDVAEGIGFSAGLFVLGFGLSFLIPKRYRGIYPSKLAQINWGLICTIFLSLILELQKHLR
jgi:hypothetical protein